MADDIADTTEKAEPGKCHLLALPAELCNEIWKLVLPEEKTFCTCREIHSHDSVCEIRRRYRPPAVLRLCQQIQREAGELWYPQLDMRCSEVVVQRFLYRLGTAKASLIRNTTWFYPYEDWLEVEDFLYITLYVLFNWNRMPAPGALKFRLRLKLDDGTAAEKTSSNPRKTAAAHGLDIPSSYARSRVWWDRFRKKNNASPLSEETIKEMVKRLYGEDY